MVMIKLQNYHTKIEFIDSFRFMSSSLCIDCKSYLDYMAAKDQQLIFKYFEWKKNNKKDFNKELINRFSSTYKFSLWRH